MTKPQLLVVVFLLLLNKSKNLNFLAHLYLSPPNKEVMLGNFFADGIQGNKFKHYNEQIKKGIRLHREIDTFTDAHPVVRQSKGRLHQRYRLYKGVIIDIFYDHFLARNWDTYSAIPLDVYVNSVYQILNESFEILPEKTKHMLPYMIEYNWLFNYQYKEGLQRVLNGMNKRTENKSQMNMALQDLELYYEEFESDFKVFFLDLIDFTKVKINHLSK